VTFKIMIGDVVSFLVDAWDGAGRNVYGPGRVEAVGADWIVVRSSAGEPVFIAGAAVHERNKINIPRWNADNHDALNAQVSEMVQTQLRTVRKCPFSDTEKE
jgi:hypothetical protein